MKAYRDDNEILHLAERDGCAIPLRQALAKMDGRQTTIIVDRRVYLVHATPGDSGFSCFEADTVLDMPALLAALAPAIGPIDRMTLGRHDSDPGQRGTRH